jgi:hypothetical protein
MGQQYGGKGGGAGAAPQLQQPSQSSTSQPQRYQPTGGNVFGYNMNRLASRMDPSASLPGENTQQQQQPQYQAQDTFQPQYQPQDTFQGSFGGKGGGRRGYEPDFFEPQYQQQYQQPPQQQQNPFTPQQPQYDDKFAALQSQLDKLLSQQQAGAKPAADSELSDTGEAISKFDKGREETGVGSQSYVPEDATLSPEDVRKGQADSKAAADASAAKIDPATGKEKYQYGTYTAATTEQLSGLSSKANISSYYNTQANKAKSDVAQAGRDLAAAQKSGDIAAMTRAREVQSEALKRQAAIAKDQKQALSQIGKTGYQTTEQIQAAQKAQSDAAAKAAADKAASQKAAADKIAADKAAAQKAATDKAAADKAARDKAAADKIAAQKAAADKAVAKKAADKAAADKIAADKAAAKKAADEKAAAKKAADKAAKDQAAAAKKPAKPMAKGGTVIVHKGMTSNLKKQLKNK